MIKVLFFASLRERLNSSGVEIAVSPNATVAQVIEQLAQEYPEWRTALSDERCLAALNQTMVQGGQLVADGDELALFPPVTGG